MVFAVTDKEKGADGGVTCFLVDREAGWTSAPIDTMGEWGPASLSSTTSGCRTRRSSARRASGFELAMRWIGKGRYLLPARALGAVRAAASRWRMEHAKQPGHLRRADRRTGRRSSG